MLTGARAGLHGADAQPLRHHWPDPALRDGSEDDPREGAGGLAHEGGRRPEAGVRGRHELHVRRPVLQRRARGGAARDNPATASTSTRPGTATRASTRCTMTTSRCAATRRRTDGPTVFATHSTHKMLAALSQASYIHVRDGKGAIDHHRFNQAYMMHTTTSPLYAIVASNDITSAMMDGSGGRSLTQEVDRGGGRLPAGGGPPVADVRRQEGLVLQAVERRDGEEPRQWPQGGIRGRAGGFALPQPGAVGAAPRRQMARVRRHRRRLVHARSDQGEHPHARGWARTASWRRTGFRRR